MVSTATATPSHQVEMSPIPEHGSSRAFPAPDPQSTDRIDSHLNRSVDTSRTSPSILKTAFSVVDMILRLLGLMVFTDGTVSWTGVYEKPVMLYTALASRINSWILLSLNVKVPEWVTLYIPIATIFYAGLSVGYRQVYGRSFVRARVIDAPRRLAQSLKLHGFLRLACLVIQGFWGFVAVALAFCFGPLAVLVHPAFVITISVAVSSWVLIILLVYLTYCMHAGLLLATVIVFLLIGLLFGGFNKDVSFSDSIRRNISQCWQGFRLMGAFIQPALANTAKVWRGFLGLSGRALVYGPWDSVKSGLLAAQYNFAFLVLLVFALLASSNVLIKITTLGP